MKVDVRPIKVSEIQQAMEEGRLQEAFGAGTAATIAQIETINIDGKDFELPDVDGRKYSHDFLKQLTAIKTGEVPDPHNWIYKI